MLYSHTFCFSTMNTTNIYCLFYSILCTDPGGGGGGAHLRKLPRAKGGRENFWGISYEKSRFNVNFRGCAPGAPPPPPPPPPPPWIRPLRSICLSLSISNSFPVYVHAVFHFASPLEIHNLYFGKHNKGDKSFKFMLQVANFHR